MGSSQSKVIHMIAFSLALANVASSASVGSFGVSSSLLTQLRGGDATSAELTLDEKVEAAMKKLGMQPPQTADDDQQDCPGGVCEMPIDPNELCERLSTEMKVDPRITMAAIGATSTFNSKNQRVYHEPEARAMIQQEIDLIETIAADSPNVKTLVDEGYDIMLTRRALAFAENNLEDARAILLADEMDEEDEATEDEEAEMRAQLRAEQANKPKGPDMIGVKANFDPTTLPTTPKPKPTTPDGMPAPASKESVVFEATTAQLQELVLESPVPVLLDVYADWCGPCKVLGPALEEMAIKSGGAFRLVKVNSDNERPVSGALEVTALPTVFGIRDGQIVHMFQGMPRSEDMMKNFMMGLFGAAPFSPPVTAEQSENYQQLTAKLIKTAGAAGFPFAARERLTERIVSRLDSLVEEGSIADVEAAAMLLRTFLNNVVKHPYDTKYRKINLENKVVLQKLENHPACLAILKSVGFKSGSSEMILGAGKKVVNVAPLVVARDTIDKWVQRNQAEMAKAARKRKDEMDRVQVQKDLKVAAEEAAKLKKEEPPVEAVDPTACQLKLRLEGKKKVHEVVLHEDDPLSKILEVLDVQQDSNESIQITCVAKRLVVNSSDSKAMKKSLKEHRLTPAASIVVQVGESSSSTAAGSLRDRAAEKKIRRKGSHTMQTSGIYAKDDNNKAELIDGGGGVWYEHDVSDDDEVEETKEESIEKEGAQEDSEGSAPEKSEESFSDDGKWTRLV